MPTLSNLGPKMATAEFQIYGLYLALEDFVSKRPLGLERANGKSTEAIASPIRAIKMS